VGWGSGRTPASLPPLRRSWESDGISSRSKYLSEDRVDAGVPEGGWCMRGKEGTRAGGNHHHFPASGDRPRVLPR
jgi:hypothetical protein